MKRKKEILKIRKDISPLGLILINVLGILSFEVRQKKNFYSKRQVNIENPLSKKNTNNSKMFIES